MNDEALLVMEEYPYNSVSVCVIERNAGAVSRTAVWFIHSTS